MIEGNADSYPDDSGGSEYFASGELETKAFRKQGIGTQINHQLSDQHESRLRLGYTETADRVDTPFVDVALPDNSSDSQFQRRYAQYLFTSQWSKLFSTNIGLEKEWETGSNIGTVSGFPVPEFSLARQTIAAFVESNWRFSPDFSGSLGVRADKPDTFASELSPRLGLTYQWEHTTLETNWSEAFKLPSFFALGHPFVGNPAFEPETSRSFEVSLSRHFSSRLQAGLSIFNSKYFNLIDFDDDTNVLVARSEVTINGIELQLKHRFSTNTLLQFHFSRFDFHVNNGPDSLRKRPDRIGSLSLQQGFPQQWNLRGTIRYVGEVEDKSFPTGRVTLDDYFLLNMSVNKSLNTVWSASLALKNILNEHYEESVGNASPGLSGSIRLSANW